MGFLTSTHSTPALMGIQPQAITDLLVGNYLDKMFADPLSEFRVDWTQFLTTSPEDMLYRRAVLQELQANPPLVEKITELSKCLSQIRAVDLTAPTEYSSDMIRDFSVLHLAYVSLKNVAEILQTEIEAGRITSPGLKALYRVSSEKLETTFCPDFPETWTAHTSGLEQLGSLRFRFSLDAELNVSGVALTSIQKERFVKGLLTNRTLKENRQPEKPWDLAPPKEIQTPLNEMVQVQFINNSKQFFQTLRHIMDELENLHIDLLYYLSALKYLTAMSEAEVETCFADIAPMETKEFSATAMVNPVLTSFKGKNTVRNDITFVPGGEILVLTGINQGGKTTFLRTVATIQLLFQLGWPVPARAARISPVDRIVTVFSHEEDTQLQHGKLGQELKTIRAGMDYVTPHSMLLCNEPVTGTSPMENLYLSREVLTACKLNGYKGVWVTHLYDLANEAEEMNEKLSGSTVSSIIAIAIKKEDSVEASYHIERGRPQFTSYAMEVLKKEANL